MFDTQPKKNLQAKQSHIEYNIDSAMCYDVVSSRFSNVLQCCIILDENQLL